jgi:hypothetical protein
MAKDQKDGNDPQHFEERKRQALREASDYDTTGARRVAEESTISSVTAANAEVEEEDSGSKSKKK